MWLTRFGGAGDIVGQRFDAFVNDRPDSAEAFTIIGVLPEGFWHTNAFTEVLAPLRAPAHPYVVRLRNGVRSEAVQERIAALVRGASDPVAASWRFELRSTHAAYINEIRPLLLSVAAATGLVLLIACANVAVLMLVRATQRRREVAVRKALGASGGHITRALLAETALVAVTATALGLLLSQFILSSLAPVMDRQLGRAAPGGAGALELSGLLVAAAIAGGLLLTVACSIAPLWAARRAPVSLALSGGQKGAVDGPGQRRARSVLIAIEVAACLTLLVGATLMVQSSLRVLNVDLGLDTRDVLVGRVNLRQRSYPDAASRTSFYERLDAQAAAIPGVSGVAFTNSWPLQAPTSREVVAADAPSAAAVRTGVIGVSAGYFETLKIAMRDGRAFSGTDRLGAERVAIVSETLASRLWPGRRAVGARLRFVAPPSAAASTTPTAPQMYLVVGVAGDTRHTHTDADVADMYIALLQQPSPAAFVYARATGPTAAVDRELRVATAAVDQEVAFAAPRRLSDILDVQRAGPRFLATLLVVFGFVAALLALIGIYGVIAYAARQREREIAVRLAIGADRSAITRLFVRQGAIVLAAGLVLGIGGALALGRVLEAQLFNVRPSDPLVLAVTTVAFALCGLGAVAWPARRAASTDPVNALKDS